MINNKLLSIMPTLVVILTIFTFSMSINSLFAQPDRTEKIGQQNQTAATAQNQTLSPHAQALNSTIDDIQGLKDNLMTAKEALLDGNTEEALTAVTDVENQLLTDQPQPKFTGDFQKIKDSIARADLNKALDGISKVQTDVLKAETEIFKAELPSAQEIIQQDYDMEKMFFSEDPMPKK